MVEKSHSQAPSLLKLGACLFYEGLVLIALAFVGVGLFVSVFGDATSGMQRLLLQLFLWSIFGFYFVFSWVKNGQTLATRSWKLKLVMQNQHQAEQQVLPISIALVRFVLATFSFICFGLGFIWCVFDRDNQFLHDRLLKTKIIVANDALS